MSVLIGLIGEEIYGAETESWDTNKIGGTPTWLSSQSSSLIPECRICGQLSTLVTQLYCPLGGSAYHRCLYVFVCSGTCSKQQQGWRVFRAMKYDESYRQARQTLQSQKVQDDLWADEQDDWGEDQMDGWGEGSATGEWDEGPCETQQNQGTRAGDSVLASAAIEARACTESPQEVDKTQRQVTESLHQLKLSESADSTGGASPMAENRVKEASPVSPGPDTIPVASGGCGDVDDVGVLEEEIGLADSERWNAMARLLNTKHEEDSSSAPMAETKSKVCAVFKSYYLYVVDEPADKMEVSSHVADLIRDYERSEGKPLDFLISERSSKGGGGPAEAYEKTELKHGDKVFHKFLKRLQRCPQQCIRYDRGGEPLLVSKMVGHPVSLCPYCGGQRVFELQLLPALIPWLKTDGGVEIDFGTVLLFTCQNNCWPADLDAACDLDLLEECVVLQADPDQHLYR